MAHSISWPLISASNALLHRVSWGSPRRWPTREALFLPEELSPFLSELTADPCCFEEALRQLEETPALFEDPNAAGQA